MRLLGVILVVLAAAGAASAQRYYKVCTPEGCYMVPQRTGVVPSVARAVVGPRPVTYSMFPAVKTTRACRNPDCTCVDCVCIQTVQKKVVKKETVVQEPVEYITTNTYYANGLPVRYYPAPVVTSPVYTTYYSSGPLMNSAGDFAYYGAVKWNGKPRQRGPLHALGRAMFGPQP